MSDFWKPWALWEKMCFVLGCSIVLTMLAGCGKLVYNHYRLRKYTAIAAEKKALQQMQQAPRSRRARGPDVPFGVRAIESGIEVDGVWISRSNTPTPSSPVSPQALAEPSSSLESPRPDHSSTSSIPHLAIPQPIHGQQGMRTSSRSPDRLHDLESGSGGLPFRDISPSEATSGKAQAYRPRQSSHLRFSSANSPQDRSQADVRLPTGPMPFERPESARREDVASNSADSSPESFVSLNHNNSPLFNRARMVWEGGEARSDLSLGQRNTFARSSQDDLRSLATHRETHGAENGQLLPRNTQGKSLDVTSNEPTPNFMLNHFDGHSGETPSQGSGPAFSPDSPTLDPVYGSHILEERLAEAQSFQNFLASDPSNNTRKSVPQGNAVDLSKANYNFELNNQADVDKRFRHSQVLRKVNSGFEILRPGTLETK